MKYQIFLKTFDCVTDNKFILFHRKEMDWANENGVGKLAGSYVEIERICQRDFNLYNNRCVICNEDFLAKVINRLTDIANKFNYELELIHL